jgi:hypothetical protein
MSQNDFTIANQTFPNTRADINSALQALASTSSGTSAPSTTFANQLWYDTANNKLYIRNEDNDANILLAELDQTNDTVEYFSSDSIRTTLIEYTDGDDALTIANGGALTTAGNLSIGGSNNELRFYEGANYVGFEAPALSADKIWVLPDADGSANQAIVTDGSGNLSFASAGTPLRPNVYPLIYNGEMHIVQYGNKTGITGNQYVCDRFCTQFGTFGTWSMSQDTSVPTGKGYHKSVKLDCTTADASLGASHFGLFRTSFEGQDLQLLKKGTSSAEKLTLKFYVKSAKTGTYTVEFFDTDNSRQISKTYTVDSANTWEEKIINIPADTTGALTNDTNESFVINWWLGAGSDFTSGTLNSSSFASSTTANRVSSSNVNLADNTSNDWFLTGVQLEIGEFTSATIPAFQHEEFAESLTRCQRYFIGDSQLVSTAQATSATAGQSLPQFRTQMRASPTATHVATGGFGLVGGSFTTTSIATTSLGVNGGRIAFNHDSSISTLQFIQVGQPCDLFADLLAQS